MGAEPKESCAAFLAMAIALVAVAIPKLPNELSRSGLPNLPLQFVQPLPHAGQFLPVGCVVLPEQPHVGLVVHPLWPLGERLQHIGAAPGALLDLPR